MSGADKDESNDRPLTMHMMKGGMNKDDDDKTIITYMVHFVITKY